MRQKQLLAYLHDLACARTIEAAWQLHCDAMAKFGFDRLIYGYNRFGNSSSFGDLSDTLFLSNHDREYFDQLVGSRMLLNAPLLKWAIGKQGAQSWGAIWSDWDKLSADERAVVEFNRSMDVLAGYTISFFDPSPKALGAISMTGRRGLTQDDLDAIWAQHGEIIETMNNMAHLKFISLPYKVSGPDLTERQREVLQWVGEGKSHQDIATILGVTAATVEKHLRLSREKLGVETTAQAVLKASFRKQIFAM